MKLLNEIDIFAPQDPSVGLFSVSLTIDLNGLEVEDDEDMEFVRSELCHCFSAIYGDTCQVTFDFERERDVLLPPADWCDIIVADTEYQDNQPLDANDYFGSMHP